MLSFTGAAYTAAESYTGRHTKPDVEGTVKKIQITDYVREQQEKK